MPEAAGGDRGDQEQDEHGAHAVEGEPLPHLGEEQRGEATRMPEKSGSSTSGPGFALSLFCFLFLACRYFFFE